MITGVSAGTTSVLSTFTEPPTTIVVDGVATSLPVGRGVGVGVNVGVWVGVGGTGVGVNVGVWVGVGGTGVGVGVAVTQLLADAVQTLGAGVGVGVLAPTARTSTSTVARTKLSVVLNVTVPFPTLHP